MKPKIVSREAFQVMGVVGHFDSAGVNFGPLWKDYTAFSDQIEPLSAGEGYYGVYLGADYSQPIDYMAGMAVREGVGTPEGVEVRDVPAALYAVFACSLQSPGSTYGFVFDEWLPTSEYEQDTKFGFDYYPPAATGGDFPMQIWFPVKKNSRQNRDKETKRQ